MGCGFGACMSCAVEKSNGKGYFHVCKDGPVFLAQELEMVNLAVSLGKLNLKKSSDFGLRYLRLWERNFPLSGFK